MSDEQERFWSKMVILGADDCWVWQRARDPKGYGRYGVGKKMCFAHRHAYALTFGPIPEGLCCLHKCDNPPCCNPSHLFLGTQADNMRDMFAKNRHPPVQGERHPRAKLTDANVVEIRRLYATGLYIQQELADKYGVHCSIIGFIVNRKIWKHVP